LYLAAFEGDNVVGVLPLTMIRSRLFGIRIVSQAFSNYGGPIAYESEVEQALVEHAVRMSLKQGCSQIEFRALSRLCPEFAERTDKACMLISLAPNPEEQWNVFRSEVRNRVRKAEKAGLEAVLGGRDVLDDFYRVWTKRMKQLGTPAYPRRFFADILCAFPDHAMVVVVRLGEVVVGGGFFCCFNGLAECRWAGIDVAYNKLAPNMLLYWSAIKHYCERCVPRFDFGRSTIDSPQYEFKRRWGAEPLRLRYQYWVAEGGNVVLIRPDSPKYVRKVQIWKQLPLWSTRLLGPIVSRSLA
jgi:FemAB-related protein (PEP-CTERM system-associated)